MLTDSSDSTVTLPLHRPFNSTESLARMHYFALKYYFFALYHWSKVGNVQRPGNASKSPEPGLRDWCQGNCSTDVEESSSASAM